MKTLASASLVALTAGVALAQMDRNRTFAAMDKKRDGGATQEEAMVGNRRKAAEPALAAAPTAAPARKSQPDAMWTYKKVGGKDLQMSVFLPDGYKEGSRFPTFVVFHGGSWNAGEASWHYPDCAYWSSRGMIAASVDYRLKERDNVQVPLECVKDAKSVIRFLRENAGELRIDPDRIVAAGGSAGGQLAAATAMIASGTTSDDQYDLGISCKPNAVILYNPWFRCTRDLSPPNFVAPGLPPFITFLGDQDPTPVDSLLAFHTSLREAGNASEYYVGKGGKHGFCNGRNPMNRFFHWSLELADRFLVKHGVLSGADKVIRPAGVLPLARSEYHSFGATGPWDLDRLFAAPEHRESAKAREDGFKALLYSGLPYCGKPVEVFAYYRAPEGEPPEHGWPAVVCVHGGGGTAFSDWVTKWNDHGYAAISMDLEGRYPIRKEGAGKTRLSVENAGPSRDGVFHDFAKPLEEQWTMQWLRSSWRIPLSAHSPKWTRSERGSPESAGAAS